MIEHLKFTNADKQHLSFAVDGNGTSMSVDQFKEKYPEEVLPTDYVDPRTAQQIYDEETLAPLDAAVLKDAARMVEDFYDALESSLPQSMKDKHGPLMADRKAKRAARP